MAARSSCVRFSAASRSLNQICFLGEDLALRLHLLQLERVLARLSLARLVGLAQPRGVLLFSRTRGFLSLGFQFLQSLGVRSGESFFLGSQLVGFLFRLGL